MNRSSTVALGLATVLGYAFARSGRKALCSGRRSVCTVSAPVLAKKPHKVAIGKVEGENRGKNPFSPPIHRDDPYFWCRDDDRKNPDVINHLKKENEYTQDKTRHLSQFRETLYQELKSHIQETDDSVPYQWGDYKYFTRTEEGKSYVAYWRTDSKQKDELILDVNAMAADLEHCDIDSVQPSPDHSLLAYSQDTTGYETYTIYVKDLKTNELLSNVEIKNTGGSIKWGKDNSTLYYSTLDDAHRPNKIWRHVIGSNQPDECLYTEDDEEYNAGFFKTASGRFLVLSSGSSETSEVHVLDLDDPEAKVQCVEPREEGVLYEVDHHSDRFYIVTNRDNATNFKMVSTPITALGAANWVDVFPYDADVKMDGYLLFENHMAIFGRQDGFTQAWIVQFSDMSRRRIATNDPVFCLEGSINKEFQTSKLRYTYSSMTTPTTWFEYDMNDHSQVQLKQKACLNYDAKLYACERLVATADDGTQIPMSMFYRKDKRTPGTPQPMHLYGYGSYEISIDPDFSINQLPLVDRGALFVIAHIRGGGEMGRTWYEGAKYLTKKLTFSDFINCADHVVSTGLTSSSMLTTEGRSAGGLLMGAVLNMRPDLFKAAVAGVPFVDVLNTMCDPSIPLTTGEWQEWGNPNERKYYQYIKEYSPYDNLTAQAYPNILVTTGLHDSRVAYWEPMKWVGRMRELKTDNNYVLLKCDLSSGHFSATDRYHYLREKAFDIAFVLDQLGLSE